MRRSEVAAKIDWNKAKVKAWSGRGFNFDEPVILDIEKETGTYIYVTYKGVKSMLRKSDFFDDLGMFQHVFVTRPFLREFGIIENYIPLPPPKEECDKCGICLPMDMGFSVEATCIENNDPEDDFEAHLCHECFGRIEGDVFKKRSAKR